MSKLITTKVVAGIYGEDSLAAKKAEILNPIVAEAADEILEAVMGVPTAHEAVTLLAMDSGYYNSQNLEIPIIYYHAAQKLHERLNRLALLNSEIEIWSEDHGVIGRITCQIMADGAIEVPIEIRGLIMN